jgi:cytochrome c oxidase subunit 2
MSSSPSRKFLGRALAGLIILVIAALFVAMVVDAIWGNSGKQLTTLSPKGEWSDKIQVLVVWTFGAGLVVGVLVFAAVGFIAWRFRDRGEDDAVFPEQVHGRTALEIGWTLLPALILAAVAVGTVVTLIQLNKPDPQALHVEVYGQQWWWGYHYDVNNDGNYTGTGDIRTATELVIPVNTDVELTVTSNDVIHSFWIPALNGKRDAVPGQHHPWKLQSDTIGVYRGQCTEFCGLSHANMRMVVRVVSQADYDAWVKNQLKPAAEPAKGSQAEAGKAVFLGQLCSSCHLINGVNNDQVNNPDKGVKSLLVSGVAPDLTHFATRGTFIGSIQNLYTPQDPDHAGQPGDPFNVSLIGDPGGALTGGDSSPYSVNRPTLESWLRAPDKMKPAANTPNKDGRYRGMPNLGLSEQQISDLVAYLSTLK